MTMTTYEFERRVAELRRLCLVLIQSDESCWDRGDWEGLVPSWVLDIERRCDVLRRELVGVAS